MYITNNCENFTKLLASAEPVPGGGGAAALCGALSVSLCSMAASLTKGKKKFAEFEGELCAVIEKCEELRNDFLKLINGDAEAFYPLSKAYSMPKDAAGYAEAMRTATYNAMLPPMEMMRCCLRASELMEEVFEGRCSALLISDIGCAASLCRSAVKCAAMNVFVNTKMYRGEADADSIEADAKTILDTVVPRSEKIEAAVLSRLSEVK